MKTIAGLLIVCQVKSYLNNSHIPPLSFITLLSFYHIRKHEMQFNHCCLRMCLIVDPGFSTGVTVEEKRKETHYGCMLCAGGPDLRATHHRPEAPGQWPALVGDPALVTCTLTCQHRMAL